jgi:hypothetical protein
MECAFADAKFSFAFANARIQEGCAPHSHAHRKQQAARIGGLCGQLVDHGVDHVLAALRSELEADVDVDWVVGVHGHLRQKRMKTPKTGWRSFVICVQTIKDGQECSRVAKSGQE